METQDWEATALTTAPLLPRQDFFSLHCSTSKKTLSAHNYNIRSHYHVHCNGSIDPLVRPVRSSDWSTRMKTSDKPFKVHGKCHVSDACLYAHGPSGGDVMIM